MDLGFLWKGAQLRPFFLAEILAGLRKKRTIKKIPAMIQ